MVIDLQGDEVVDDPLLLELMLRDMDKAPSLYQPTQYWRYYLDHIVNYLRHDGLRHFRRESQGILSTFGATDLHPVRGCSPYAKIEEDDAALGAVIDFFKIVAEFSSLPLLPYGLSMDDLNETAYRISELEGKVSGAKSLKDVEASLAGDPEFYFTIDGRKYTPAFLYYYWRYCYCCRHCNFDQVDAIVELGSGAGKQVEVIKKLHPHLTIYLLDIAPQLYICSQYLKAIFPGDVVDYREHADVKGKIHIRGSWQIEQIAPKGNVLFWSAASFGEMEPPVVENYLAVARRWSDDIYLMQCMKGKELATATTRGVQQQTRFEHYQQSLRDQYNLVDRSPAYAPLKLLRDSGGYEDTFWKKR
ncbi:MAG: putative sugar O-methyltransferase [Chlamydiales bacterium]|nr:putative sugar O-methyltransferase [Chlamydiia bacterium]MCP5507990.1 putative sugar O-methyltransferase [Chlamydiales bacterium]